MKKIITVLIGITMLLGSSHAQHTVAKSWFKKGELKYNNGNYKGAIEDYTKAINLDPKNIDYYLRRGFCRDITGDYKGAIEDFTKVIEIEPKHKWAYLSRGSAFMLGFYLNHFRKILD